MLLSYNLIKNELPPTRDFALGVVLCYASIQKGYMKIEGEPHTVHPRFFSSAR